MKSPDQIEIVGVRTKTMNPDIAAALVGAALLSVMLFPTIAGVLLGRKTTPRENVTARTSP